MCTRSCTWNGKSRKSQVNKLTTQYDHEDQREEVYCLPAFHCHGHTEFGLLFLLRRINYILDDPLEDHSDSKRDRKF